MSRTVSEIMLSLISIGMLTLPFNVQPVKASGTIYIRADGSIDPPTAPISTSDNITYTLTADIYDMIVIQRDNIVVDGAGHILKGTGDGAGIYLSHRSNVTIRYVTINSFYDGICLEFSNYNTMMGCNITANNCLAIRLWESSCYNSIVQNNIAGNHDSIGLQQHSNNNTLIENNITTSHYGIIFEESSNNTLRNNKATRNKHNFGIFIDWGLSSFFQDIDTSNTVDGKPVYYWINRQDVAVPFDAGYVALINCTCITVRNLNLTNNIEGMMLAYTTNSIINGSQLASNERGIWLHRSSNNTLTGNNITDNECGIILTESYDNHIYHNNFMSNLDQIYTYDSRNTWDDGYPSGGNYWGDYNGVDLYSGPNQNITGSDGIGDTPYVIDAGNQDNYPLMTPWLGPWRDWNHYHNYTEIVNTLLYLNATYPDIVDVFSIGKSWQNLNIYCIRLTNETNTHPKPKVFFVGYHHAREPITAELALYFAVEAATKFGTNATITYMLNYSEIYIVVALNVDGFDAVKRNEWQRKNARPTNEDGDSLLDEDPPDDEDGDSYIEDLVFDDGTHYYIIRWEGIDDDSDGKYNEDWVGGVDLNRNYDYEWEHGSSDPESEIYKGPAPFSEPETQAIRNLALQHVFKYAISFHSGAELILYPWGYTYLSSPDDVKFKEIAKDLSDITGGTTHEQSSDLYVSYGTWDDWMYGDRGTFALTCEIYTNHTAWQYEPGPDPDTWWEKGVFQYFNPDPNDIETVIKRWLPVFTYITNRSITEAYDIATSGITFTKNIVEQGFTMQINVTAKNEGDFAETFNVTAYANMTSIASKIISLPSGGSTIVSFVWNTTSFARGNYTVSTVADTLQGETDIANNNCTSWVFVTWLGDLDADTDIDEDDLWYFCARFIDYYEIHWKDPNCDFDDDCDIDEDDLWTFCAAFIDYWKAH